MEGTVDQADLLRALREARNEGPPGDAPPQLEQRIEKARALFRVALQSGQPAVRSIELAYVLDLSVSKTLVIIRHLCGTGEIEMRRVTITNTAGASQPVPAYVWIGNTENVDD